MAETPFDPIVHDITESRQAFMRARTWMKSMQGEIDFLLSGVGGVASFSFVTISTPSGTSPVADAASDTLVLLAGSNKISITGSAAADSVTFDAVEANFSLPNFGGILPVAKGGTGSGTSPSGVSASTGFTNLAPPGTVSGQVIAWNNVDSIWQRTETLGLSDNDILMGDNAADLGVAVRRLSTTYFTVDTGAATVNLADDGVANTKLANMAEARIKGRAAGAGTGDPTDLTGTEVATIIGSAGGFITSNDYRLSNARVALPHVHRTDDVVWGTFPVVRGGTGLSTFAQGDLIYATATATLAALAKDSTAAQSRYLSNTGASNNPLWAQVSLTNGVTGTLPIGSGGTGQITRLAAFNALAPSHGGAAGSLIAYDNGVGWIAFAGGDAAKMLVWDDAGFATQPVVWADVTGDVSMVSGVFTIAADAITFAKFQNITTDRLLGRDTAGTGNVEEISLDTTLEFTGSLVLRRAQLTGGDVTASAGSNVLTIANDAVTFVKFQNITTDRLLGRDTAGTGDVEEISLDSGTLEFTGSQVIRVKSGLYQPLDATLTSIGGLSGVQGDILYASGSDTWALLAKNTASTRYLSNTGGGVNNPAWAQVSLSNGVFGLLPINSLAKSPGVEGDLLVIENLGLGATWVILTGGGDDALLVFDSALTSQPVVWRTITGDVTNLSGVFTIANDAVTFAKMQNSTANSVLVGFGASGAPGNYTEITLGSGLTMTGTVLSATATAAATEDYLVRPRPPVGHLHWVHDMIAGGTPSATTFLRGDGNWATPAGISAADQGNLILLAQVFGA